jgi:hypothetical protein
MDWKTSLRRLLLAVACLGLVLLAGFSQQPSVLAETTIFASPIQAGCYLARVDQCKIHVDPFTINIAAGKKLVFFQLVAIRMGSGRQTVIYNFHTDQSNPAPSSGTTYLPSAVAKDFAAACSASYQISLQGQDSGDLNALNLGMTNTVVCPTGTYKAQLPLVRR